MNDLPLLLVLQAHPAESRRKVLGTSPAAVLSDSACRFFLNQSADESDDRPDQLLKGIQIILTGHDHAENVPPDLSVHPLLPGQFQDFGTKLRQKEDFKEFQNLFFSLPSLTKKKIQHFSTDGKCDSDLFKVEEN